MKGDNELSIENLRKQLNERQIRFVHELLANGDNQTRAAIAAGYSERSAAMHASRMMKNDKVAAYKRACARQIYANLGLTPEKIGLDIYEVFQRCMAAKEHLAWDSDTKSWVPDGTWTFDARGAVKALELLGKMCGAFEDKVKVEAGSSLEEFLKQKGGGKEF